MSAGGLDADVEVHRGTFGLAASLRVGPGETVAVVGPNGAGKTTLLRALAGLVPLEGGRIVLGGRVLDDVGAGVAVPVEDRPVGVVFQDHLLFPHLDAVDNVAFGLRSRGIPRRVANERALVWLERVGLGARAAARPAELSGGQAQRVALARALATEPDLLLLDEPLTALDAATRVETRRDLRRHLAEHSGVRIVVTHDPLEAAALAERLVVLEAGHVVQEGSLADLTARPRTRYVADLVGVNLLAGWASGSRIDVGGLELVAPEPGEGDVLVVVAPRAVTLSIARPSGTARNVWPGRVEGVEAAGDRVRVLVAGPARIVAEVTGAAADDLGLREGSPVWVAVKATELEVFPA